MNQKNLSSTDVSVWIKNHRAKIAEADDRTFKETGISTKQLAREIKAEIDRLANLYNHCSKQPERFTIYHQYEKWLYSLLQDTENGFQSCLEIYTKFTEVKKEFQHQFPDRKL